MQRCADALYEQAGMDPSECGFSIARI